MYESQQQYEASFANGQADEVFEADHLPEFAKSHILPRKMDKNLVEARKKQAMEAHEAGDKGDDKKFSEYKLSLLKTSLEHYDSLSKPNRRESSSEYQGSDLGTLKTLKMVRKAVSKWKKKADSVGPLNPAVMSPRKSLNQSPIRSRLSSESVSPKKSRSRFNSESAESPKKSKVTPPQFPSGRQSRSMSKPSFNCAGPGDLGDYISYVKSGILKIFQFQQ